MTFQFQNNIFVAINREHDCFDSIVSILCTKLNSVNKAVFWDVGQCCCCKKRHFGGMYRFRQQGD
jgi:hypothetical protein